MPRTPFRTPQPLRIASIRSAARSSMAGRQVGVHVGRSGEVSMPEDAAHHAEILAGLHHQGCERMPQIVEPLAGEPRAVQDGPGGSESRCDCRARCRGPW